MDKKTRLLKTFALESPDRPAILGGWLAAPNHIQAIAGCSDDDYWADPFHWGREAERRLGSDGLIGVFTPAARGGYRNVDQAILDARAGYSVEDILAEIDRLPEPDQLWAEFDEAREYAQFAAEWQAQQAGAGDMLWCEPDWYVIPRAIWYHEYGENAFVTLGLYPERYRKLLQVSAARGRQRALVRARAIRAGICPPALLSGEDLCSQEGLLVSPRFLRAEYYPLVEYALEPLLQAGAKVVWHCDGNSRPVIADLLTCGIGGLQGFQTECGMDVEWIAGRRTRAGDPLLILGAMSVTTTLLHGTPAEVAGEVRRAMRACRDRAALAFFVSNTITPDIPLENIYAFWEAVRASKW